MYLHQNDCEHHRDEPKQHHLRHSLNNIVAPSDPNVYQILHINVDHSKFRITMDSVSLKIQI